MSIQTHWNYILRWSPRRQKMLENALFVLYIITLKTLQDFYFILRRVKIYFGLSRPRPGARVQEKFKGVKRMTSKREGAFWNPYELGFLWTLSTLSGLYMQDCLSHIQCLHGIRKRHFSTSSWVTKRLLWVYAGPWIAGGAGVWGLNFIPHLIPLPCEYKIY